MTLRFRLGLVLVVSACGGRSSLPDDGGAGGASSSLVAPVGATASAVTTGGGEGGGYVPCTEPTIRPPAVIFEPLNGMPVHDLALVSAGTNVVLAARFTSGSQAAPDRIGHATWDAWGAWPPAPFAPLDTSQTSWATPPVLASASDGLAISFTDYPGCAQWIGAGLDSSASYASPESFPFGQVVGQGCGRVPLAIAGLPGGPRTTATVVPQLGAPPGATFIETAQVSADGTVVTYDLPGCGGWPVTADLAVINNVLVIATSNSADRLSCDDPAGYPNNVVVGELGSGPTISIPTTDDVADIRFLPRPGGVWLLYRESGASAFTTPPVSAVALDDFLSPGQAGQVTSAGLSRFAAAPLENGGFVIVSDESIGSGGLDLRTYPPSLFVPAAEYTIPTGDAFPSAERFSIVASPDRTSALIGWTGVDGRGYAARVDCMKTDALP